MGRRGWDPSPACVTDKCELPKEIFLILKMSFTKYNKGNKYDAVCFGPIVSQFKMTTFLKTRFITSGIDQNNVWQKEAETGKLQL